MTWRRQPGVGWKVYVDAQLSAQKQAVSVAAAVADRAVTEAKTGADRALTEAKTAMNAQFKELADKLELLGSRAGGAIPRSETEALFAAASQRVESQLSTEITRLTGLFTTEAKRFAAEVATLNTTVTGLHDTVIGAQAKGSGIALTGRMVAGVIAALVGLVTLGAFLWALVPHR